MNWITKYKGAGPWEFEEQRNKWGYLNNPRWSNHPKGAADPISASEFCADESIDLELNMPVHFPCGHWHKKIDVETPMKTIETYIELLSSEIVDQPEQSWQPDAGVYGEEGPLFDVTYLSTFRPLDTADYDGTATYTFEAVCFNHSEKNSGYVYLVDESDNIVATIEVPVGTYGHDGGDFYALRSNFTPTSGSHEYGLRIAIANVGFRLGWTAGESIVKVLEATIIVKQTGATKSRVHIPMMVYVNSRMAGDSIARGSHVITTGREALSVPIYTDPYSACEIVEDTWGQIRQIFKFNADEFSTVSKVVFDAAVGWLPPSGGGSAETAIIGFPDFSWLWGCLRWCTLSVTKQEFVGGCDYDDPVCVDILGRSFTYIEDSSFEWDYAVDGSSLAGRLEIDITSLAAASGNYIYFCSNENVLGGSGPSGTFHHWDMLKKLTIPPGASLSRAYMDYNVFFDTTRGDERCDITFTYEVTYDLARTNDAYIMLYDKTADAYVAGSEMIWDTRTDWERKSVEFDISNLTDGHEYMARWKSPEDYTEYYATPYVSDINLYIHVEEITSFTSYRRVAKGLMSDFVFYYIPPAWCTDCLNYDSSININSRSKVYLPNNPDDYEVYFECSAWDWIFTPPKPSFACLYDTGEDDHAIGSVVSENVAESLIVLGSVNDGFTYRIRSSEITTLVNGRRYVIEMPGGYWVYQMLSGFIVIKYLNLEISIATGSDLQEPQVWSMPD